MIDPNHLCMGCMKNMGASRSVCPYCGFQENEYISRLSPKILPPKTILEGKYLLGKVLGEGGFGITYLAWDLNLEIPLAIKEYFPNGLASRSCYGNQCSLSIVSGSLRSNYEHGLQRFADEARTLARLQKFPGVVNVRDFFFENSTGYLVMDYIKGMHLGAYVKKNGPFSEQEALSIMKPLIRSLQAVHKLGMIHRDISPDNILREPSGNLILIDFGSARMSTGEESKSLTILLKRGYAPLEQYQSHGRQGSWTDIYALCATLYYMMSGKVPQESIERITEDQLLPLHQITKEKVSLQTSRVIQKGLSLKGSDRYQNLDDFMKDLYPEKKSDPPPEPGSSQEKPQQNPESLFQNLDDSAEKSSPKKQKKSGWKSEAFEWIVGGSCLLLLVCILVVVLPSLSTLELSGFLGKPIEELTEALPTSLEWEKTYNKFYRWQDENGNTLAIDTENGICHRIYSSLPDTSIFQIEPKTSTAEEVLQYFNDNGFETDSSLSDSSSYYAVSESTGITVIVTFNQEDTVKSVTINN
ncbi:serine/threonine protein kinase [Blautia sp. An249]|uniref:serine/threonine protein kinase n=1 Tax=Blautia sp. An249 TaxID=1965603 RepID=UPI0013A603FE|nr:serine/threonine-protein kinase [Blautia sp. An249]